MTTKQENYDIEEWSQRLSAALDNMRKNEKPGAVERGGKRAVLSAMKEKIREVMNAGYSAAQIAYVLKQNGLPVLPKSITETARGAKPVAKSVSKTTRERKKTKAPQSAVVNDQPVTVTSEADNTHVNAEPIAPPSPPRPRQTGSFEIIPDTRHV